MALACASWLHTDLILECLPAVQRLHQQERVPWRDMAVLYRFFRHGGRKYRLLQVGGVAACAGSFARWHGKHVDEGGRGGRLTCTGAGRPLFDATCRNVCYAADAVAERAAELLVALAGCRKRLMTRACRTDSFETSR